MHTFDYVHSPDRLTRPLIRRGDTPKSLALAHGDANPRAWFREASWEEALDLAANGLIPMILPDYQRVDDAAAREKFENLWGCKLDGKPGLTVVEIMRAADAGAIRGMYIMGENPAMSDPDPNHTRRALARLEHLVVQDIFLTETAAFADVILPASALAEKSGSFTNTDRRIQLARQAIDPPGAARQDLALIIDMAPRPGMVVSGPRRCLRGNAPGHAQHRRNQLGTSATRGRRDLPLHQQR